MNEMEPSFDIVLTKPIMFFIVRIKPQFSNNDPTVCIKPLLLYSLVHTATCFLYPYVELLRK